jgi:electron transport complex protein RnfE
MGVGFTGVLVTIGALREVVGQGSLLDNAQLLFGEWGRELRIEIFPEEHGFLLALLPPGAFLAMGLLIAVKNLIDARLGAKPVPSGAPAAQPATSHS